MSSVRQVQRLYPSLLLEGPSHAIDIVMGELFDRGCLGTEALEETARQRAYFPPGTDLDVLREKLARQFVEVRVGPVETVSEQDWVALSRREMSGFALGQRFFLCPSWESPPLAAKTQRIVLRIDPEQAFGTGHHDTTRLCLELLESCAGPGLAAIDMGTGTGILAMAAAALGCRPVVAIDIDPIAAACAQKNARRNRLGACVEVSTARLEEATPPPANVLVANLHRPLLDRQMERLAGWLEPGGLMILSGVTIDDVEDLASLLEGLPRRMKLIRYHTAGDWAALLGKVRV